MHDTLLQFCYCSMCLSQLNARSSGSDILEFCPRLMLPFSLPLSLKLKSQEPIWCFYLETQALFVFILLCPHFHMSFCSLQVWSNTMVWKGPKAIGIQAYWITVIWSSASELHFRGWSGDCKPWKTETNFLQEFQSGSGRTQTYYTHHYFPQHPSFMR